MTAGPEAIAARWADELPREFSRKLAAALRVGPEALQVLKTSSPLANSYAAIVDAIKLSKNGDGPYAAGLLAGRLTALAEQPSVVPVWTGPDSTAPPSRLTVAVVADLIRQAEHELLLTSYVTYPSKDVRAALESAVAKGVALTLLLDHTKSTQDPFPKLAARRLVWPKDARPNEAWMHAKLLVVDRRTALVGSANLTENALGRNLECGVQISGGPVPGRIVDHILGMGALVELSPPPPR